jgi:hypothetical protein
LLVKADSPSEATAELPKISQNTQRAEHREEGEEYGKEAEEVRPGME